MSFSPTTLRVIGIAAVILVLFGILQLGFASPFRNFLVRTITGTGLGTGSVLRFLGNHISTFSSRKIQELEAERITLLGEIARGDDIRRENEALRAALALRSEGVDGAIPASVAGAFRAGRDEFLLLNRGVADGIAVGDIVLDARRVFGGTVTEVTPRTATVRLITSPSASIEALLSRTDTRALIRGANSLELVADLVPGDADVNPGDLVVTSRAAVSGQRSFLIGEVREARKTENSVFKVIRVFHLFDISSGNVIVLIGTP